MKRVDDIKFRFQEVESFSHGKKYQVFLEIPMSVGWIDKCSLIIESDDGTIDIPMQFNENLNDYVHFSSPVFYLKQKANYNYYFKFLANGNYHFIGNRRITDNYISELEKNKKSVLFQVPEWAKNAVMYHVFVDRFYRGSEEEMPIMDRRVIHEKWDEDVVLGDNKDVPKKYDGEEVWNVDYYGGDLKGVICKLDYLASLGTTIIYLSPIPYSQSNHGYDTINYFMIDPYKGCEDDLRLLCDEAHKRGMKVILDAVFNHVGDRSVYFDRYKEHDSNGTYDGGVFDNPNSKYKDFFRYYNGNHTFWFNFPTLPELDCDSNNWSECFCGVGGVIDYWFSLGIDGLRFDVADSLSDRALEEAHDAIIRNKSDALIIGEVWDDPFQFGRSYISSGRSMHTVMNYQLVDALIRYFKYQDIDKLARVSRDIQVEYPFDMQMTSMNFTSTHDISRPVTIFGKKEFDPDRKFNSLNSELQNKIYEALWEIGYSNQDISLLLNGNKEIHYDEYCTMMNKLSTKHVGFETLYYLSSIFKFTPFSDKYEYAKDLPEDIKKNLEYTRNYRLTKSEYEKAKEVYQAYCLFLAAYPGIMSVFYGDEIGMEGLNNLANRRPYPWGSGDMELLKYFQQLGRFRKDNPALRNADFRFVEFSPQLVSFVREGDSDYFVAINNTREEKGIYIPEEYKGGEKALTLKKNNNNILSPYGGIVIKK